MISKSIIDLIQFFTICNHERSHILKRIQDRLKIKESDNYLHCMYNVTWSTTERREIRNFPYPSVFELTARQRLTVKRGIRNVGQLRLAC